MYQVIVRRKDGIDDEMTSPRRVKVGQTTDLVVVANDEGAILYAVRLDNFESLFVSWDVPQIIGST